MEWVVAAIVLGAVVYVVMVLVENARPPDAPCPECKGTGQEQTPIGTTYHVKCGVCSGTGSVDG
jgi:hypothetical protein